MVFLVFHVSVKYFPTTVSTFANLCQLLFQLSSKNFHLFSYYFSFILKSTLKVLLQPFLSTFPINSQLFPDYFQDSYFSNSFSIMFITFSSCFLLLFGYLAVLPFQLTANHSLFIFKLCSKFYELVSISFHLFSGYFSICFSVSVHLLFFNTYHFIFL